jgi:hypothetical protein
VERAHFLRSTPKAVRMIYRDRVGRMRSMLIPPDTPADAAIADFRTGVHVDPEHVWRDGNFMVAETSLRRTFLSWTGLAAAGVLLPGELVEVSHPRPAYGAGGRVTALDGFTMTLGFEHGLEATEPGWLALSTPDGGYWGSLRCFGAGAHTIELDPGDFEDLLKSGVEGAYEADFREWIITEQDGSTRSVERPSLRGRQAEPTRASVGRDGREAVRALIVDVSPAGDGKVEVLAVRDVPEVHDAETAPMPAQTDIAPALVNDLRPAWEDVAIAGPIDTGAAPAVADFEISGPAIPGAVRYFAQVSGTDSPTDWQAEIEAAEPQIAGPLGVQNGFYIRVAAAGPVLRGPWRVYLVNFANAVGGRTTAEFQFQED